MAYKYSKDKDIFDEVVNSISSNNNVPYKTNNRVYEIYDAKHNNSSIYNQDNDFLKQIDTYSNNYAKKSLEREQEEYYNKNKEELIKQRTNSLIYNWNIADSGGAKYNYNGSKDTSTSDFYTNLGVNDLSLNNFLITNEEAENKKKSRMWQQQEEIKNRFKNIGLQNTEEDELDSYFKSIGDKRFTDKKVNPYENNDSYYKKYIEKFNTSIKEGNIKAANNALQNINKKYFGADYSDGMLNALLEGMRKLNPLLITNLANSNEEDASILEQRFNSNVKKLEAINSSINNGVDDTTLNKLEAEKSRLEFENQLIQYNKLTTLYSVSEDSKRIDEMYKKVEDPFKNIDLNLKWDKDKGVVENVTNNFANLFNTAIQTVGATSNAMMEMSFNSISELLTNDIENEDAKMFTAGIIDFAEYLVPYVGQAKLYIDTASSGSVALPGLYDNLIAKPLGLEEQSSAILGDNPSDTQTFGACIYVAMNFVLDKMISNSSLGKFAFDGKTQEEISKMTFGNIMKALGITSFSEGLEEFFQAYGEDMMYGDKDRSIKDVIASKETFKDALRNMFYAMIVSGSVGGVQVGTSKANYHNSITTDTKYAHVNNNATSGINVDSTSVEKVDNAKLTDTIVDALQSDKSVDIVSTDIDGIDEDLSIDYNTTPTNIIVDETTTDTNTYKSNIEAITFDSTEKTILETLNNPKYYEAKGLSESPTLQEVYDLLLQYQDPITEKLFYYNELYGNRKYDTFINNLNNGKITPELVADKVLPANNSTKYSPNDIKNNTVTTIVPSQEMANFILSNNPNADVEVLDVKSPTFNEDVKNYVNGKATYNLNLNKKVQNEKVSTTVDSKTVKNLNTELTDLNNTLSKVEAEEDTPISKIKIDNSALANGNFADISNNVQENLLNTLDTENYSTSERREALSKTLNILNKYNDETRTPIKQKGGKPIVFDKTGFNTYETGDTVFTDNPAIVNSTGKFIYGNSDAKLNLSERAVNKINNMIDKLDLNGDKLTTRSTHKDVAELVNKNKDMAKEILQVLGYDGMLYGKQKTKLITATDNNDSVDIDKALNKTSKQIDDIMAADKKSTSKEDFIAKMQIAKETLSESTKTKPVKIGSKQLDSKKSNIKVESDLNRVNNSITEAKVNSAGNAKTKSVSTKNTPIPNEVTIKTKNIEIKGNPESISVDTLQDIDAAFDEVSVHSKKSAKELKNSFAKLYSAIFDRYSPILKIANDNSNLDVKNAISDLWTLRNRVHNNIKVEQTDINGKVVGKSLDTIKKQIKKQDLNDFQKCIRAVLNVERINNNQDRVLNLDAKKSQQYYESLIKKHPYFKNVIDDLRVWNTNNTQKLYDAGLINANQKQALDNSYQIYAPIYSAEAQDFVDIGEKSYNTRLKANDTLKPTTKQGKSILDIWTAFVVQEQNLENSILKNNTYKAMANSELYNIKGKGTDIIYYDNGKINKFTVENDIAQVFQKYNIEKTLDDIFSIPVLNWFPKLKTKVQQKMLTSYDPIYTANNMFRDFGDSALFYSKYPLKFGKNYIRAAYNAANNSVLYQNIVNTGIVPKTSSTNKFARILTSIESLPKMAEYMSAIESGKTPIEAKLEAQDVNLNFARGGYATQALNSKGWLFLNASAQALDKTISTVKYDVSKVKENPIKGSLNLLMKVGAMSAPAMLNALMNQDDDDYEKLPYYYKNNYYMIKLGDNKFLRIPKGRIVGLVDTLVRYASGIDEEIDLKTYLESIYSSLETSILPQDLIESSPFGEITAIKNNKNYYGAEIYDENASLDEQAFSIINYVSMNIFGRYGKAFKNLMDRDSTTDIVDINSYVFDSTKYDKNLSTIYTLRDKYQYQKKNDKDMSIDDKIMKKYIDTKVYAISSISGDINKQKANGATLNDMKDLYQMRDSLTQDTIDNYNKYEIDKSSDIWTIYFDDETYTYDPNKDTFKKLKK